MNLCLLLITWKEASPLVENGGCVALYLSKPLTELGGVWRVSEMLILDAYSTKEVQQRLKAYRINCTINNIKFESMLDTFVFKTSS